MLTHHAPRLTDCRLERKKRKNLPSPFLSFFRNSFLHLCYFLSWTPRDKKACSMWVCLLQGGSAGKSFGCRFKGTFSNLLFQWQSCHLNPHLSIFCALFLIGSEFNTERKGIIYWPLKSPKVTYRNPWSIRFSEMLKIRPSCWKFRWKYDWIAFNLIPLYFLKIPFKIYKVWTNWI